MLEIILDEFINYLAYARNYSERTLPSYRSILRKFFEIERITKPTDITPEKAEHYLHVRREAGIKKNTNATFMNALRAFLIFCNKRGYARNDIDDYEVPKREKVRAEYLTDAEIEQMVSACSRERDRLILLVMFTSGVRIAEVVKMTVENTHYDKFTVQVKGGKPHTYMFDPSVAERLHFFLQMEGIHSGPIWRSTTGKPVGIAAVSNIYRKATKIAKINKNVTSRFSRRSFATGMLASGADIYDIKEALGHENVQTTQRYVQYPEQRRIHAHAQYAPKVSYPTPVRPLSRHRGLT